ncbi:MAG: universal stress protein [Archaeoglobaceae archaeon]
MAKEQVKFMLKRVLFPTDFSQVAEGIIRWLPNLKNMGVEEVVLVRVINLTKVVGVTSGFNVDSWIKHEEEESEKELSRIVDRLKEGGIGARYVTPVPRGDPVAEVVKSAEEENVDFIVIGSKGKGFLKEILMGSISEGVVRKSKIPVMVAKPKCFETENGFFECEMERDPLDRILFAYDFSEHSQRIIDYVKDAAVSGGNEVIILNVVENKMDKEKESLLESAENELKEQGIDVKVIIKDGSPYKEVIKTSKEENASMVMMGSRGMGFLGGAFLGSTTDSVVRQSEIPVFVFKS